MHSFGILGIVAFTVFANAQAASHWLSSVTRLGQLFYSSAQIAAVKKGGRSRMSYSLLQEGAFSMQNQYDPYVYCKSSVTITAQRSVFVLFSYKNRDCCVPK